MTQTKVQLLDLNGLEAILDADADTKIQASTDDNIEFLTGGAKQFNITNSGSVQAFRDSATSFGPSYLGQHQRGTIASPSIVSSGDRLVEFKSTAYDGTAYIDGPRISFRVDGTPGDDDMPSRIEFQTVADGANSLTERMRIHSGGVVSIPGGVELGSALDATAANTLDDYEEGTWTPVIKSNANTITGGSRLATYTKVGRMVHVFFSLYGGTTSGTIDNSGDFFRIEGLPFTAANVAGTRYIGTQLNYFGNFNMTEENVLGLVGQNESKIEFVEHDGAGTGYSAARLGGVGSNSYAQFAVTYYVE